MGKLEVFRDGNFYLILRNGVFAIHGMYDGRRVRKSTGTDNRRRAMEILESTRREYESGWREDYADGNRDWKDIARAMNTRHKSGALKRGLSYELKASDIYDMMKVNDFHCAISGIPLAKRTDDGPRRDPWGASVDRIESRHGYTLDNSRVVCLAANMAMNNWGHDVVLRLARGIIRVSGSVVPEPQKLTTNVVQLHCTTSNINDLEA